MSSAKDAKITYTSTNIDMSAFHAAFDEALAELSEDFGKTWPLFIGGESVAVDAPLVEDRSPIDTDILLGRFQSAGPAELDQAVSVARGAQRAWARRPWGDRVAVLRQAATLIRERKYRIAALMSVEVGKSRLESMGDTEEAADLIDYYCQQLEDAGGFVRRMKPMTPIETNTDVLRPYGVFACIAPFNFPMALSTGMSAAALVAGNAVVYKPAKDTPWTGLELYLAYRDAGVPAGVFNYVTGIGSRMGDHLALHPGIDGVVFTGSKDVGMHIFHGLSQRWVRPCLLELGGKNPAIVMETADLDMAAEGVMKSAWGLQNQKCSACSRVYVHSDVAEAFLEKLIARTAAITIGDPTQKDVYFGPVINEKAVRTWERAVAQAREEGEVVFGGMRLTAGALHKGYYVAPTIAVLPRSSSLFMEELFVPFLAVTPVDSLEDALAEANRTDYGLTAGIYSGKPEEVEQFFDEIEAGVTYANKRTGATTGAWPGAQPFCGWKASGGSGKGGCGPYYVAQFMREQSRTLVQE